MENHSLPDWTPADTLQRWILAPFQGKKRVGEHEASVRYMWSSVVINLTFPREQQTLAERRSCFPCSNPAHSIRLRRQSWHRICIYPCLGQGSRVLNVQVVGVLMPVVTRQVTTSTKSRPMCLHSIKQLVP